MVETGIGRIAAQNVFAANRYTISNAGGLSDEDMEAVIDAAEKNKKLDDMKAAIENYLAAHYI